MSIGQWDKLLQGELDDLSAHLRDEMENEMPSRTEDLKREARELARSGQHAERLSQIRTILLCRGYALRRGKRGGVTFQYVGVVPDNSPLWAEIDAC